MPNASQEVLSNTYGLFLFLLLGLLGNARRTHVTLAPWFGYHRTHAHNNIGEFVTILLYSKAERVAFC